MTIKPETKIIIIEGVPGAGKSTLKQQVKEHLKDRLIYNFSEEEMLFSWKHIWIPEIDEMRLTFFEHFLSYIEQVIQANATSLFLLDRFHLSYQLYTQLNDKKSAYRYAQLINRLKALNAFVLVPMLNDDEITERASHQERKDPLWQRDLKRGLEIQGFKTLREMYSNEQKRLKNLLEEQGLDYEITRVER